MLILRTNGAPCLKQVASRVTRFDDELLDFVANMHTTMYTKMGIGLAANQVGDNRAIFVATNPKTGESHTFINPRILETSGESSEAESCLSFPGEMVVLSRPTKVVIKAQNSFGEYFTLEATGLLARCILHEMDHLNGLTFFDRVNGEGDAYTISRPSSRPRKFSSRKGGKSLPR